MNLMAACKLRGCAAARLRALLARRAVAAMQVRSIFYIDMVVHII